MIHATSTRRQEATRRRILDAALALVAEGGLDALTVHALADAVDYTPGALYRYFPSRDAIVVVLELEVIEALHALTRDAPGQGLRRLVAMVRAWQGFARMEPRRYALVQHLLGTPRHVLDAATAAPIVGPLRDLVAAVTGALDTAGLGGPDRAVVLLATLHGVLQLRKLERLVPDLLDVDRLSTDAVRALLIGFGADRCALDDALEDHR